MANISKEKRDRMLAFLEELKKAHSDDASIRAFNEIENHLKEKKYGLVWEEHTEEVDELLQENIPVFCEDKERRLCKDETLPWNFIIEGDNLQALYLLEKTHRGKIDCIYIDPPYNTGAKDWKYNNNFVDGNDTYRHSKWLSMMKNRLAIAKRLLASDGALICAIDENELQTLGLLLKELFTDYAMDCIAVVHNPGGIQGANFSYCHEYAYFVYPKKSYYIQKERRNNNDELTPFRDWGKENSKREGSPNCFYPIIVDVKENKVIGSGLVPPSSFHPSSANELQSDGTMLVWPSSQYIPHNLCGKIIKYKAYWNVYLLKEVTDEILEKQKLAAEARAIRKEWIKRGITKGDVDHNTCQLSIDGVKKRYDCFKIDGGIPEPEGEAPTKDETPLPPTPVSDYAVDDSVAIQQIFQGEV